MSSKNSRALVCRSADKGSQRVAETIGLDLSRLAQDEPAVTEAGMPSYTANVNVLEGYTAVAILIVEENPVNAKLLVLTL